MHIDIFLHNARRLQLTRCYFSIQVTIFFHNRLLRGNRSTKADTAEFHAFWSLNMHPLAELGINIKGEGLYSKFMLSSFLVT